MSKLHSPFCPFLDGSDYISSSQTVTFSAMSVNGTQQSILIPIIDDSLVEPNESIIVQGSEDSVVAIFQPFQTTINILNNDGELWH